MSEIIKDIENLVAPLLTEGRVELVDVTYQKEQGGWTLCFYLDQEGGITLDDCEKWSQRLGDLIDSSSLIQQRYVLEVSSPGIHRPLKKLEDFKKHSGERVAAKLFTPLNGQKNFHGILLNADEQNIYLKLEDTKMDVILPRRQVAKCKLDPLFEI